MLKHLSAKYYQENKERLQIKLETDIKIFLRNKMKKSSNIVVNGTKTFQKMKRKKLVEYAKVIIEREETLYNFLSFFNKSL